MSDGMAEGLARVLGGEVIQNEETPGFHLAFVGGGEFGQPMSVCAKCGALLPDEDKYRTAHAHLHTALELVGRAVVELESPPRRGIRRVFRGR